jgi:hypothetical protein
VDLGAAVWKITFQAFAVDKYIPANNQPTGYMSARADNGDTRVQLIGHVVIGR